MKFFSGLIFVVLFIFSFLLVTLPARADEIDELTKQIGELQKSLEMSRAATTPLLSTLKDLENQIASIQGKIAALTRDLERKKKEVAEGEKSYGTKKIQLEGRVREMYKHTLQNECMMCLLFEKSDFSEAVRHFGYQKSVIDGDKESISQLISYIKNLETKKGELESETVRLAAAKTKIDGQAEFFRKEIKGAQAYQASLGQQIAELSAKQQEIINARSGGFTASIGDSELADDYNASIKGFRESAPSGYFAVFSFGAHTHRKGMSQYGARGRAQQGQSASQILKAYYGKEPVGKDTGGDIQVSGHGSMNFEDKYLMGIAEMPSSWHPEALKAQAIAARTYAYRYKVQGTAICTTEACQVYNSGKASSPPQAWKEAVQATRGQVLEDVVTYYASTHGGFASPIGWDTTDGGGGGNFVDKAYDKLGGSPWLYKAWYTQGYSPSSDKCGRSNPWLSPEEMADIVNAAIALKTGGIDTGRITPVTTSCWGGNPYSMEELRNLVSGKGGISSATSVSVTQGNGSTNSITVNGVTMNGDEFKKAFNVRAPGRLSIPQSGFAFYNVEKK